MKIDNQQDAFETVEFLGSENNRLVGSYFRASHSAPRQTVLLMHGGGQTRYSWQNAARQLAKAGYDAITLDARGHGESEWPEKKHYSFEYFRDDLHHVASHLRGKTGHPPILIGASLGGISAILAQDAARAEGDKEPLFAAIVLVDITPRMALSGVVRILSFMADKMHDGFASIEEAAEAVAAYLPNRQRPRSQDGLAKNLRQREDGRWYWHWDPAFVSGPQDITKGSFIGFDALTAAAATISVPTLLVRGGKSELVTTEAAEEFLTLVPHARFTDGSGAGHMVAGDKNDVFAGAVLEFLSEEFGE